MARWALDKEGNNVLVSERRDRTRLGAAVFVGQPAVSGVPGQWLSALNTQVWSCKG